MLWNRKKIRRLKGTSKTDIAAIELANLVKIKAVVLPAEIDQVCHKMSEKDIKTVIRKLKRYKIVLENGVLKYSKQVIGDEQMRENELRNYLIKKEFAQVTSDMIRIGTRFYEGLVATGFPQVAKKDWLRRLLKEKENLDFSFFIVPEPLRNLEIYLQQQLKQVESELYKLTRKNITDEKLEERKCRGYHPNLGCKGVVLVKSTRHKLENVLCDECQERFTAALLRFAELFSEKEVKK